MTENLPERVQQRFEEIRAAMERQFPGTEVSLSNPRQGDPGDEGLWMILIQTTALPGEVLDFIRDLVVKVLREEDEFAFFPSLEIPK